MIGHNNIIAEQFYKYSMNILSTEQMQQAELTLSQLACNSTIKLKLPLETQLKTITHLDSSVFPCSDGSLQKEVQKMISLCQNLRSLKHSQPNAVFHMLTYILINILYQDKYNGSSEGESNQFLLETIKCSLYSHDMEFNQIKHVGMAYQTSQLKIIINHFLLFMQQQMSTIKANTIKCVEWIFQENPQLLLAFTLFLRVILMKLGVEQAKDFRACVNVEQAVTNLVEYFDLHYRNFGELILFYQDGLFLTVIDNQIIVGEYYQNQREKQNQKQQLEIKSSVKLNMIESVLMNVDKTISPTTAKKKGIVDSDVKLFNFMLDSSSEDQNWHQDTLRQRDCELQTPHFRENSGEFHFMKKKRSNDYKPEEIRNQFQKLIMDESLQEEQNYEENVAATPYLGNQEQYKIIPKNESKKQFQQQKIDSPIEQLQKIDKIVPEKEIPKNYVSHSTFRKTTEEKEKYAKIFNNPSKKELAVSAHSAETHCISAKDLSTEVWTEITNCGCRKTRIKRNFISSKVVEVVFIPQSKSKQTNYLSSLTQPKFIDHKLKEQRVMNNKSKQHQKIAASRKPAFLRTLKKRKQQNAQRQNASNSMANESLKFQHGISKATSQRKFRQNNFKSCVEDIQNTNNHQSRSTPKLHDNKSAKTISVLDHIQQTQQRLQNAQLVQGHRKQWQTISNFIQQVPQYKQISNIKASHVSNPNVQQTSISPLKFYAPVQIVAPTVYLNTSDKNQNNNIVIQLHEENGKLQMNPEIRQNRCGQSGTFRAAKGIIMRSPMVNRESGLGFSPREILSSKKFI